MKKMVIMKLLLVFILVSNGFTVLAQNEIVNNFTKYIYPYHYYFQKYGSEYIHTLRVNGFCFSPSPALPEVLVHEIQDSLSAKLNVKQKTYTVKVKLGKGSINNVFTTDYDRQGRVTSYTCPKYVQTFTYYRDSIIEKGIFKDGHIIKLYCKYDSQKNLLRIIADDDIVVCERVYEGNKLISSNQISVPTIRDGSTIEIPYKYSLSYLPGTNKLQSISSEVTCVYDEEQPDQIKTLNGIPVVYNLKNRLIDYSWAVNDMYADVISHAFKYNYTENGALKSIIKTGPIGFSSSYLYDNKGRLTAIFGSIINAKYSYLENGLIDKMGDNKLSYSYY